MSIIIKKIGQTEYAYLTYRQGRRVVQQYLGPSGGEAVAQFISRVEETKRMPRRFKIYFWDTDISQLKLKQHSKYIIERLLEIGDLDSVLWLQRVYPTQVIINVLGTSRSLSEKSKNFWLTWFGVGDAL
jgi:hypothetical protein